MTRSKRLSALFCTVLSVPAVALMAPSAPAQQVFSANLDGAQEVPPVASTARAWATVSLTDRSASVFVATRGLTAVAAHLHSAPAGRNGPVILALTQSSRDIWTGAGVLSPAQVDALRAGGTYINVHSAAHPGGEIRGQVVAAVATRFAGTLTGAQQVPPNASTATGTAVAFLHEPDRVLTYVVRTRGLANVSAAHVHWAPRGQNGAVVVPLTGANGQYCGVSPQLDHADVAALKAGDFYVNVHTGAFPGGEIRGQLAASPNSFVAALDGGQEVPPVSTAARGTACFRLTPSLGLSYVVATSGLQGTAAHIHRAAAGSNGPVLFPLTGGPAIWRGVTAPLSQSQLADAVAGRLYVNVHSATHPGGEIRGQVAVAEPPAPYGRGCTGSNGSVAEIGATGVACIAAPMTVTLFGALPSVPVMLDVGVRPTAIDLGPLGAPGCVALVEHIGILYPATTDGTGCATATLSFPLEPAAVGLEFANQWFIRDPANPLGVVTSNGLRAEIR